MAAYGKSKHEAKLYDRTTGENTVKGAIFSYSTMETYQRQVGYFADYLESKGLRKISISESVQYIQPYLDSQVQGGKSPYSVHTSAAAICKATGISMSEVNIPKREICNIVRSRSDSVIHDERNSRKAGEILEINKTLGLRRSELLHLKTDHFTVRENGIHLAIKSKGGRMNEYTFSRAEELEIVHSLLDGKGPGEFIFDRQALRNDADFHSSRRECFVNRYNRLVADFKENPEKRIEAEQQIKEYFSAKGKHCPDDLNRPYVCRGSHRQSLISKGQEYKFDKVACYCTAFQSHNRISVLVDNYLT